MSIYSNTPRSFTCLTRRHKLLAHVKKDHKPNGSMYLRPQKQNWMTIAFHDNDAWKLKFVYTFWMLSLFLCLYFVVVWQWTKSNHIWIHESLCQQRSGPCLTTVIWRCRNPFSQWQRSFQRKLRSHWLKFLRRRHVAVVRQGPEL